MGAPSRAVGTVLNRLDPTSLRERAGLAIRASIITGELRPGEIYPISYFATRLGVSATPVREALLDLAGDGLIEVAPNRGFRVTELSEHDLDEIFQVRLLLEVPSVAQVVGRLHEEEEASCRELARQSEACAAEGDLVGFLEYDRAFHAALLSPLENQRLVATMNRLRDQARLRALPSLARSEQLVASAHEHAKLLDAVVVGDRDAAQGVIRLHLEHTRGLWAGRPEFESGPAPEMEAGTPIVKRSQAAP
jgi:DNA-binding GntR family transcriptional regulator